MFKVSWEKLENLIKIKEGKVIADIKTEGIHLKQTGIIDSDLIYLRLIIESGGLLKSSRLLNIYKDKSLKIKKK